MRGLPRRLIISSSKCEVKNIKIESTYNSKSWRTIHSARSMERLSSLNNYRSENPLKLNLREKILRIKSKYSEK